MDAARSSRVIVLTGPPGIGKTALAVHWGHARREDFPDGALYEDLHGHAPDGPARPSEVLGRFLRALGVAPHQVPAELAELTALYRSLVIDKQMLVVLDDALTAAQVYPLLPPSAGSVAVVTSRWRLGGLAVYGARVVQLDRLDSDAALELLSRTLGDDRALSDPHAARELVDLCAKVPLAVCVAGARLAARSRWPISEMVQALAQERRRLAALAMEDDMAVRPALDLSYRSLEPNAARMYQTMGLYPGTRFDSNVAAAAAYVARSEARRLLGVLTDANLLDDAEDGQYRFHDLTRLHAREMAEQLESVLSDASSYVGCSTGSCPRSPARARASHHTGTTSHGTSAIRRLNRSSSSMQAVHWSGWTGSYPMCWRRHDSRSIKACLPLRGS